MHDDHQHPLDFACCLFQALASMVKQHGDKCPISSNGISIENCFVSIIADKSMALEIL